MDKEQVQNWISKNQERIGLKNPKVVDRKSGESNYNYIIKNGREKYILRISRKISRKNRLENEAEKLDFLTHQGLDSVPEKIFFEKDSEIGTVLIETFVGEKDLDSENMTDEILRSLAQRVSKLHNIPVKEYSRYSSEKYRETVSLQRHFREDFKKWSERPYKEYLDLCEDPDPRLGKFFEKQKNLLDSVPETEIKQSLVHGDLGFNIRATGNKVFIVDWEFCRIDSPDLEILYCFEHEDLSQSQRNTFLNEYRKHRELTDKFDWLRQFYPGFLAFNDAIWAAKRIETDLENKDAHQERLEKKLEKLESFHREKSSTI